MPNKTDIEWCDYSSNPIHYLNPQGYDVWACVKVSDGCKNCYAEAMAKRFKRGKPFTSGHMADLTAYLNYDEAVRLLTSRAITGKRVFIGDMTDIYGEWVPDKALDMLMVVFCARPDVQFYLLTKRPLRMAQHMKGLTTDKGPQPDRWDEARGKIYLALKNSRHYKLAEKIGVLPANPHWPPPNVFFGTSVENQETAENRVAHLLSFQAALHFISYEPALGPVHLSRIKLHDSPEGDAYLNAYWGRTIHADAQGNLIASFPTRGCVGWVVAGGETGPNARPCDIVSLGSLLSECDVARVPFFLKQLGSDPYDSSQQSCSPDECCIHDYTRLRLKDRHGADPAEWPEKLRVRQWPVVNYG